MIDTIPSTDMDTRLAAVMHASTLLLAETTTAGMLQRAVEAARDLTGARRASGEYGPVSAASPAGQTTTSTGAVLLAQLVADNDIPNGIITVSEKAAGGIFSSADEALLAQWATLTSLALRQVGAREDAERWTNAAYTEVLADSEEGYRLVADYTYDWELWEAFDGSISYSSPSCQRITGYPVEAFLRDPEFIVQLIHPNDRDAYRRHCALARGSDTAASLTFRIRRADGTLRWIEHVCQPAYARDGRPLGRRASNRDITDRQEAEEALRVSEARFHAIFQDAGIGMALGSHDGSFAVTNPCLQRMLQYTGDELRQLSFHNLTHPEDLATSERLFAELLAGQRDSYHIEKRYLRKDSTILWAYLTVTILRHINDDTVNILVMIDDITAIKQLDQARDDFLSVLSHELQTPLTSILGWAELAIDQDALALYQRAMPTIFRNAQRQQYRINELLDFSKLLHQRLDWYPEQIDLAPLVRQAVEDVAIGATETGVRVTLKAVADALPVTADPRRLRQCLDHLLQNGVKFTPAGGTVTVTCRHTAAWVEVAVRDTGRGLLSTALPTLFSAFHQVDRDETAGGLGLGLAIVRGILALHGGRVTADSAGPGQGSLFTLRLPLCSSDVMP